MHAQQVQKIGGTGQNGDGYVVKQGQGAGFGLMTDSWSDFIGGLYGHGGNANLLFEDNLFVRRIDGNGTFNVDFMKFKAKGSGVGIYFYQPISTLNAGIEIKHNSRSALTIRPDGDIHDAGLAFRNADAKFLWNLFKQDIDGTGGPADLVLTGGYDNDINGLNEIIRFKRNLPIEVGSVGMNVSGSLTSQDLTSQIITSQQLDINQQGKTAINLQTQDNTQPMGISFQNSGGSYTWNLFREDIGGDFADLVLKGGKSSETQYLSEIIRFKRNLPIEVGSQGMNVSGPLFSPNLISESLTSESLTSQELEIDLQGKTAINLKTQDNTKEMGISFQNDEGSYTWNLFRESIGGSWADLVLKGGLQPNIDDLDEIIRFKHNDPIEVNVGMNVSGPLTGQSLTSQQLDINQQGKTAINLKTQDNTQPMGISFQNSANSYTWNLVREDVGSNNADLVLKGGLEPNIDDLEDIIRFKHDSPTEVGYGLKIKNGDLTAYRQKIIVGDGSNNSPNDWVGIGEDDNDLVLASDKAFLFRETDGGQDMVTFNLNGSHVQATFDGLIDVGESRVDSVTYKNPAGTQDRILNTYYKDVTKTGLSFEVGGIEQMRLSGSGKGYINAPLALGTVHELVDDTQLTISGAVHIGPADLSPNDFDQVGDYLSDYLLWVENGLVAENFSIANQDEWIVPDYVFAEDYKLLTIKEMADYVKKYSHLPGIPSAEEIKKVNHYDVHKMLMGQLKNIEELLLHTIEQEEKLDNQQRQIDELTALVEELSKKIK